MACHVERQPFIYFRQPANPFQLIYSHSSLPKQKLQTTFLNNACNSVHKQQELFRRIAETKGSRTFTSVLTDE